MENNNFCVSYTFLKLTNMHLIIVGNTFVAEPSPVKNAYMKLPI